MESHKKSIEESLSLLHQIFRYRKAYIESNYQVSAFEMDLIAFLDSQGAEKMRHIADYFRIKLSTLTNAIDKSEKKGILSRSYSQTDRRIVSVKITSEGKKIYQSYQKDLKILAQRISQGWDKRKIETFEYCLKAISGLEFREV